MLWEHQALTCSRGQSEGERKVKAKEETDAKRTSNKRDKSGLGVYLLPKMGMPGFATPSKEAEIKPQVFLLRQPE